MGEKIGKSWSFNVFSSGRGMKSVVALIIIILISFIVQGGVWFKSNQQERRQQPVLVLNSILADIREFQTENNRLPKNFLELRQAVWEKTKTKLDWTLGYGNYIFVHENYEYIFYYDLVDKRATINIWAMPLGKFRDNYKTVFLVVVGDGQEIWTGAAFNRENRRFVINNGFNPPINKMIELNMTIIKDKAAPAIKKNKFGF